MKQSLLTLSIALPLAALAVGSTMCEKPKTIHQLRIDKAEIELDKRWDVYSNSIMSDTANVKDFSKNYDSLCNYYEAILWYKHATETENQYKR